MGWEGRTREAKLSTTGTAGCILVQVGKPGPVGSQEVKVAVVHGWWRSERRPVRPSYVVTPTGLSQARGRFHLSH